MKGEKERWEKEDEAPHGNKGGKKLRHEEE
jgi:hypothetical protein